MVACNCFSILHKMAGQVMGWPHYLQWRYRLLMARHGRKVWILGFLAFVFLFSVWKLAGSLRFSHRWVLEEAGTIHITQLPSIVVVEEHHEVLKYWFEAVHKGLLKSQGLTLLHIDGHSDMSSPQLLNTEGFPNFRMPRNYEEVRMLMQSNDVFIQGTIMPGVINRTIWVWPSWDHKSHEEDYELNVVGMGITPIKSDKGLTHGICVCHKRMHDKKECTYEDREMSEEEKEIEESQCQIKRTFYFEEVRDVVAMKLLEQSDWLHKTEHLLLDIDEDFFGVEEAMKIFYDVGFEWKLIQALDYDLSITFCPHTRETEREANSFLVRILKAITNCQMKKNKCEEKAMQQQVQEIVMSFVIKAFFANDNPIFCTKYEYTALKLMNKILEFFAELNFPQLKVLTQVGFCRMTTQKTFTENSEFMVCHGFTLPNETVVTLHTPTTDEFNTQMTFLEKFVTHSGVPKPKLTTICRSIRDGYTPKRLFRKIEDGVLKITSQIYENTKHDLLFDEDLLGGKSGWNARYKQ